MSQYQIVSINEETCIGCTKCINACPVDAIVGATQMNHAVLTEFCIGCELCLPVCPVNCIDILTTTEPEDKKERALIAKKRIHNRNARLATEEMAKAQKDQFHINNMQNEIAAALARNQQRKKDEQTKNRNHF